MEIAGNAKMFRRIWQRSLGGVVIALIVSSTLYAADAPLKMSGHNNFPPLIWEEGDKLVGAAVDVMTQVFGELGITVEARYSGPWKRMLLTLEEGGTDLVCGIQDTEERRKIFEFTAPICEDRAAIFVWQGKEFPFETLKDLEGKSVGDIIGSNRGPVFEEWKKTYPKMEYVTSNELNVKKLEAGRIDCFVTSPYIAIAAIKALGYQGKVVELPTPISKYELVCGMSKKSSFIKYLPEVNKRLEALRQDGTIDRMMQTSLEKYYQAPPIPQK